MIVLIWEYQQDLVNMFLWYDKPTAVKVLQTFFDSIQMKFELYLQFWMA